MAVFTLISEIKALKGRLDEMAGAVIPRRFYRLGLVG